MWSRHKLESLAGYIRRNPEMMLEVCLNDESKILYTYSTSDQLWVIENIGSDGSYVMSFMDDISQNLNNLRNVQFAVCRNKKKQNLEI